MKKMITTLFACVLVLIFTSCSTDNLDENKFFYTSTRYVRHSPMGYVAELPFDDNYKYYIRNYGAVLSMGEDTTFRVGESARKAEEKYLLSIAGDSGYLQIDKKEEFQYTYRDAETLILQFSEGEYETEMGTIVICKDSAYLTNPVDGARWRRFFERL